MPLNPIRWDNIGAPQFTNSGYGVAGAAFGEASEGAARFAKSMREQEEKKQEEARRQATNAAIIRGMQDGVITAKDYQGVPKGADMGVLLEKFGVHETRQSEIELAKNQDIRAKAAQKDTFENSNILRQEAQLNIDALKRANSPEALAQQAKVRDLELKTAEMKLQSAQFTGTIAQDDYVKGQQAIGANRAYDAWKLGTGEGTQDSMFNALTDAELASMKRDPNAPVVEGERENHKATLKANYEINNPNAELRKFLEFGGTTKAFYERPEGQLKLHEEKLVMEAASAEAVRVNANKEKYQLGLKGVTAGTDKHFMTVDAQGGLVYDNEAKKGTISEAKRLVNSFGIDPKDKEVERVIDLAFEAYPNLAMFGNRFKNLITDGTEGWVFKDKVKVLPEGAYALMEDVIRLDKNRVALDQAEMDKLPDGRKSAIELTQLNRDAAASGGEKKQEVPDKTDDITTALKTAAEKYAGMSPAEINKKSTVDFTKASTIKLDTITQDLTSALRGLPPMVYGTAIANKEERNIRKLLEKAAETNMRDRRSITYKNYIKKMEESLTALQGMNPDNG